MVTEVVTIRGKRQFRIWIAVCIPPSPRWVETLLGLGPHLGRLGAVVGRHWTSHGPEGQEPGRTVHGGRLRGHYPRLAGDLIRGRRSHSSGVRADRRGSGACRDTGRRLLETQRPHRHGTPGSRSRSTQCGGTAPRPMEARRHGGLLRPGRGSREARGLIEDFDRARPHYVALTRLHWLLVFIASGEQDARFGPIWGRATRWSGVDREALGGHRFGTDGAVPGRAAEIGHLEMLVLRLVTPA